jgi:PAS domain S-box-containing protein
MGLPHSGAVKSGGGTGQTKSPVAGYILSFIALAAAIALRWLLDPVMGDTLPLVTVFAAVAAAIWLSGLSAAVIVTLLGYVIASFFFIEPRGELTLDSLANQVGFAAYLFTCGLIIVFGVALRTSRAREADARELLRVTLRSIGDAVITTDVAGNVTYLNTVAASLTGWTEREALGQPLATVFPIVNETTREQVENPAERALRDGVVVGLANHTVLIRRDGTECPIDDSAAPIRDERGHVSGCVLIFRDVTVQRQLERDKHSQLLTARRLASIVESSEAAIIGKRLDGTIESWNAAAERLFGYPAAKAVGHHISLVIPPERLAEEDRIIATLKEGRRIEHFETERLRSDGQRIALSLTISPIRDASGNVIGASKIARDITRERQIEAERKELEDNLRKLATQLSAADKRKDEFLATLAHELRGPLAPLANVLELWKRSGDRKQLKLARETMERQLSQLVRLVDDLLDLSRVTHDRLELRKSRVDLAAVIEHAVEACRPIIDERAHRLSVTLPAEPCILHADPARLAQVFANLLNNSSKYTDKGGHISVGAQREGDTIVVRVRDSGIGIPADKLDTVFDMFSQVGSAIDRSQGGLGIGLTLVKQLVAMHDGTVEATSAGLGKGSEFVVRLPVDLSSLPTSAPTTDAEPTPSPSRRILVVDDNVDSAQTLATLLTVSGHTTVTAHDGISAIEAAEKHRPEVVLLDIGLPKMNGRDVCRRLRELPWGDDLVLIAVTGWDDEPEKWKEAGFDAHLVKPARYDELSGLLSSLP